MDHKQACLFYVNKFLSSKSKYRVILIEDNFFFLVHCPNVVLAARFATHLILSIMFSSFMSHFALMLEQF